MPTTPTSNPRDVLSNPLLVFALLWLPGIAIVASGQYGQYGVGGGWRTAVWTAALAILGTACVANAIRCGRVHCYFTGPFFFAMAVVTLLYGLGFVSLGRDGWNAIGLTILVGAIALSCLPEMMFGKYRRPSSR